MNRALLSIFSLGLAAGCVASGPARPDLLAPADDLDVAMRLTEAAGWNKTHGSAIEVTALL